VSDQEPVVARVTVAVELADGSTRTVAAERPDKVTLHAWREPVDLIAARYDPVAVGPSGASVSISGGEISTGYVPAQ
jgi:hypothetical protein